MTLRNAIDISILVSHDTPVWPGDTPFSCAWTWDMRTGSSVNVSATSSSPHVGTHADTPLHVTIDASGSESLDLAVFCGDAVVIDVTDVNGTVDLATLNDRLDGATPERVLLRSGRGIAGGTFPNSWPCVSPDCARELVARGLLLLGVDSPSVDERDSKTLGVHHALLDAGASVLENLDLRDAPAGRYLLTALPMRVRGLDAAPVRAVLTPR